MPDVSTPHPLSYGKVEGGVFTDHLKCSRGTKYLEECLFGPRYLVSESCLDHSQDVAIFCWNKEDVNSWKYETCTSLVMNCVKLYQILPKELINFLTINIDILIVIALYI